MLEKLLTPLKFITLFVLLAAAFSAGRALAGTNRITERPLFLTNISSERVCGRPADGSSQNIVCYPDAQELETVLEKPIDVLALDTATCALDGNEWKCWAISSGMNQGQLKMFAVGDSKNLVRSGNTLCHQDFNNGIVSCTQNYAMAKDPLRLSSSLAPSIYGDHFGIFKKLVGSAGAPGLICFIDDDVLKCASESSRPRLSEKKLKNATALAVTTGMVCVIDESGNRCFATLGEDKSKARASWKKAKKLSANGNDLCAILATDDVECMNLGGPNANALARSIPEDLGTVLDLGVGKNFACALRTDRSVRCWSNGSAISFAPASELKNVLKISVASSYACALVEGDGVVCWGDNERGQSLPPLRGGSPIRVVQAGNVKCSWNSSGARCMDTKGYGTPPDVVTSMPPLKDVVSISLTPGYQQSACAITKTESGTRAQCWGDAAPEVTALPAGLVNPKSISLSEESGCAVLGDDTVRCWGKPVGIPWNVTSKAVEQVDIAKDRTCLIDHFGFICYGPKINEGPLRTPEKYRGTGSNDVLEFALGTKHTCVRTSLEVECWGDVTDGQQLHVPPMANPISLLADGDLTCASDDSGVQCWGPSFANSNTGGIRRPWNEREIPP